MIIDTHVHLDDERYREDFDLMMERAYKADVRALSSQERTHQHFSAR